jgi:hypothetical protein
VETWIEEAGKQNNGCNLPTIRRGVRVLAVFASRTGATCRRETDWATVRRIIVQRFHDGSLRREDRNAARYVWRLDPELSELEHWPMRGDQSTRLVSETAIRAAVGPDSDFSDWTDSENRPLTALVDGPYGVRRWLRWASVADWQLGIFDLPPREFIDPSPNQARWFRKVRRANRVPFFLGRSARRVRLGMISAYAGWAAENGLFDGRRDGLDVLCDPKLLQRFAKAQEERRGNTGEVTHGGPTDHGESGLAKSLALIASPYLEATARKAGDEGAAARFRAWAKELKHWGYGRQPSGNTRKDVELIDLVWSAGGREGYLRLIDLVDCMIADAEERVGMSLDETVAAIREEGFRPPSMWATSIRGAFLVTLERRIPLRLATLSWVELQHWETYSRPSTGTPRAHLWQGAIYLSLPGNLLKSQRPFRAAFVAQSSLEDPVVERLTRRTLLEAYLMQGGARDLLLDFRGKRRKSPYLLPASAGHGAGMNSRHREPDQRWKPPGIRAWLSRAILAHAREIGLDPERLESLWGGSTVHTIRALFGTYWMQRNPEYARVMLDHAPASVTTRYYSGMSASKRTLEVDASEIEPS